MNDFEWDCAQKKRIAQGEKHRVKQHRGCTLPHEKLTPAQTRKRNGDVILVNINRPMSYREFKTLSRDTQITYLEGLRERFNVNDKRIADMMGLSPNGFCQALKARSLPGGHGTRMSEADLLAWAQWLAGDGISAAEAEPVTKAEAPIVAPERQMQAVIRDCELTVYGTAEDCFNRVFALIDKGVQLQMTFSWHVAEEVAHG